VFVLVLAFRAAAAAARVVVVVVSRFAAPRRRNLTRLVFVMMASVCRGRERRFRERMRRDPAERGGRRSRRRRGERDDDDVLWDVGQSGDDGVVHARPEVKTVDEVGSLCHYIHRVRCLIDCHSTRRSKADCRSRDGTIQCHV